MYPISRIHLLIKTLNNLSQELTQAVTSSVRGGGGPVLSIQVLAHLLGSGW